MKQLLKQAHNDRKKLLLSFLVFLIAWIGSNAQVGIGTNSPNASARLEISATNKGLLLPRIALAGTGDVTTIASPATSLLIYNTATAGIGKTAVIPGFYFYNGSTWSPLTINGTNATGGWSLNGNAGTNGAANFIGTTDDQPLKFRVNNITAGGLDQLNENVAFGLLALDSINGGGKNIAIGFNSLHNSTIAFNNIAIGSRALHYNLAGSGNVAIGTSALVFNESGNGNVANGFNAAYSNISGFSNVAIGTHALYLNKSGYRTIAMGDSALFNNTGSENLAIGSKSLYKNTSGVFNTAVGNQSLFSNIDGSQNTAIGKNSLFSNSSGIQNTAVGFQSAYNNSYGKFNTSVGYNSLFFNEAADDNTALGHGSLFKTVSGGNTAVGSKSLNANTSGFRGTAVGWRALEKNITGSSNTAVGSLSLDANESGDANTSIGDYSMNTNVNGSYNVAFGAGSLNYNYSGNYNVAIGVSTLAKNVSGVNNTAIGAGADVYGGNYVNATAIGANAQSGCSNCLVLGSINGYNSATASTKVGVGTINPQQTLHVSPNGPGGIFIGSNITSGGYTGLNMGISQESGGYGYIQATKAAGTAYGNLILNQNGGNVGIRTIPLALLHLKQTSDVYPITNGGIRLERWENTAHWDFAIDGSNDLCFAYNGASKFFFDETDGSMTTVSDLRKKKDIKPIENALPAIMQLRAKTYRYTDNEEEARFSYGFIAQDVEKIFPDFVSTKGKEEMKAIGYQKINVMAIKAIQEQQVIIENQEKKIAALEEKMELVLKATAK